jgi:hypothetical protein
LGSVDVDRKHHRIFFGAEVDLGGKVIDDVYAVRRPADVSFIEHRARHELDVEASERLGQAPRLQHAYRVAALDEMSNQNVAKTAATTSYES